MQLWLTPFFPIKLARWLKREKCACFHCGDAMRVDKAVVMYFAGQDRLLCCFGCHAILVTVQKNNLVDTYLSAKAGQEMSSA